jgi:GPH family glycoside/pentoside/hexuronide:cation symporter
MSHVPHFKKIAEEDRIPLFQKLMFAAGQNTDYVATGLMTTVMWMPFFNIGMGISPVVLGFILMFMRAWDAITDPIMGNISDNARTPWGRRKPFMFVGAILTAAVFPLVWYFPDSVREGNSWLVAVADCIPFINSLGLSAGEKSMAVYLTLIGIVFFTCFTTWSMPYYGLQLELTPNYDERTRLTACMTLVAKLTSMVTSWAFAFVILIGMLALGDPKAFEGKPEFFQKILSFVQPWLQGMAEGMGDEKPVVVGMRIACWFFVVCIVVLGLLPALFVKERYYEKEAKTQASEPLWQSLKESLRCGPLWSLIAVSFFLVLGYSAIGSLGQYVSIYYVCHGDLGLAATISGLKGTVLAFSGIFMIPLFTWLGGQYDKRTIVIFMLGMSMFGHLLNWFLMTPANPYLQIISGFFESSAIGAVWMFLPSMKADVADYDEQKTTKRREGAINAFYSWFIKASLTASMGIGGIVLQVSGFDVKAPTQPDEVLNRMFLMYLIIPVVIWLIAALSLWVYPLTRARCAEIRELLENRRGVI